MAQILASLTDRRGTAGEGTRDVSMLDKYPWDQWADGQVWQLKGAQAGGTDFGVTTQTMRVYIYNWKERINSGEAPQPDTGEYPTLEQIQSGQVPQWKVKTKIMGPGVIRLKFERDKDGPKVRRK